MTESTQAAKILCGIYADLLGCQTVTPEDDFFVLGGHSLLATRLVNRIKTEFHVELSLKTVFENPTAAELAERMSEGRPARPALRADGA